jgi:hypothetical protein
VGRPAPAIIVLLLLANAIIVGRFVLGGADLAEMQPRIEYNVTLQMAVDLHGDPARIRTFLPQSGPNQAVESERIESRGLSFDLSSEGTNRSALFQAEDIRGHETAVYSATVDVRHRSYEIPEGLPIPGAYPTRVLRYLEPTENVQSGAPEILEMLSELLPPADERSLGETTRILFDFVQNEIRPSEYENTLDAVTTLKWKEAFCGGKSRLLIALLRGAGIPSRIVGGLILTPGSKRVTHVWTEAWMNGVWVPMDALNDHYAEHPDNYLVLYHGDEALFSRTKNINFQYVFNVKKWRVSPDAQIDPGLGGAFNAYAIWDSFGKAQISLNLLRIVLLLPVGVLIVIFFRNIVGFTTFGTFHPALIAVAFRDSGLGWGILLYTGVLAGGMLLRVVLDRVQLLHTPRLALLLTAVVMMMLGITYISAEQGILEPARISMFPIAILAITIESYFTRTLEVGTRQALWVMAQTLVVISVVYWVLDQHFVQAVVFTFPELLLAVAAAFLMIGRYVGMRVLEYWRFRWLIFQRDEAPETRG